MDIHNGNHPDYKPFMPKAFKKDMEHYGIVPTNEVMTPNHFMTPPKKADKGSSSYSRSNASYV